MKKITSLVLALVMIMSLCVTAFAAENDGYTDPNADTGDNTDVTWNFTGADENLNELDEDNELALVTSFKDVKRSDWYYSNVMECAKLGIVNGFEDGTFKPENSVTGVQFLIMLTRTFYADKLDKVTTPKGQQWYYPYTKVASDVGMSNGMKVIDDNAINRYEMALVLYNVLTANGKAITISQMQTAMQAIKDYSNIPTNYRSPVVHCYAHGIITGHEDGSFGGTASMTRAQACTVVSRMMKLINKYNPGDKDSDQYDDGKPQDTGNTDNNQDTQQPTQQSGKLANGKDATVANVLEILDQIKQEYPTGTAWGPQGTANNHHYTNSSKSSDVRAVTNQFRVYTGLSIDLAYGCGGWMAMVSDRIFGQSGAPAREVTDPSQVRPGDLVISFNSKGQMTHVGIASESAHTISTLSGAIKYGFTTCDGNADAKVSWGTSYANLYTSSNGSYCRAWTRYPD